MNTANFEVDTKEATDLLTMDLQPIRIACRVREYRYLHEYKDEFTIRAWRYSGVDTELQKIMSGHCDYMFYGFSDPYDKQIISYFIGDLKVFRREMSKFYMSKGKDSQIQFKERANKDNNSMFLAFDLNSFPEDFIIKRETKPILF